MANYASGQIMYRSRYKSAILAEGFGVSPIMSVNYEWAPVLLHQSFYTGRIGLGFLPARKGSGAGFSIPLQASYNFKLPKLVQDYIRSLNTFPPRFKFETFIESGVGGARIVYPGQEQRNYYNLVLGLREQLLIDIPPKPRVIYARVTINPRIRRQGLVFYEVTEGGGQNFFGGVALGVSF